MRRGGWGGSGRTDRSSSDMGGRYRLKVMCVWTPCESDPDKESSNWYQDRRRKEGGGEGERVTDRRASCRGRGRTYPTRPKNQRRQLSGTLNTGDVRDAETMGLASHLTANDFQTSLTAGVELISVPSWVRAREQQGVSESAHDASERKREMETDHVEQDGVELECVSGHGFA